MKSSLSPQRKQGQTDYDLGIARAPLHRPLLTLRAQKRRAIVLIAVLVVVVLLSLAAYQFSELMTAEYRAADASMRAAQARALAISGVHYAAAALADQSTFINTLNANPYDNESAFRNIQVHEDDRAKFSGRFSLMCPPPIDDAINGSTQTRFGVIDEAGKINLNALVEQNADTAHDMLMKLPNMTEEIADAIIDWIDTDEEPRANGAEGDYYGGQSPSYRCKNGPLDSLEELLMVRGVTPDLLFGTDRNRNGLQDTGDTGDAFDPGWAAYLTVYSRELNRDSTGEPRIYLNDSDLNGLYDKLNAAVGEEIATWVLAYRLHNGTTGGGGAGGGGTGGPLTKAQLNMSGRPQNIAGIYYLIDSTVTITTPSAGGGGSAVVRSTTSSGGATSTTVTVTQSGGSSSSGGQSGQGGRGGGGAGTGGGSTSRTYRSPLADQTKLQQYLPILLDKCTTRRDAEIPARVNVNTASKAVLMTLPGLEEADVQAIMDTRPQPGDTSDPAYQSSAWLLTQAKLTTAKVRALERYVTGQTQTFRVQSLGYFDSGGLAARVEAVIDTNGGSPRIIYFRDLTELGRGFDLPR